MLLDTLNYPEFMNVFYLNYFVSYRNIILFLSSSWNITPIIYYTCYIINNMKLSYQYYTISFDNRFYKNLPQMKSERSLKVLETIHQGTQSLLQSLSNSYGPKGLDKMLIQGNDTVITNDGATILSFFKTHPIHKILSDLSASQDSNCGDGTTSVVLLACSIFDQLRKLKNSDVHPSKLSDALELVKTMALKYIDEVKIKIDEKEFINVALTSLNSKIASKSNKMAKIAVESLKKFKKEDLRIIKRIGGDINDIEMYNSLLINKKSEVPMGRYKVMIIQFGLSSPKTNIDSKIIVNDYEQMERFVNEEKEYILDLIQKVRKSGANLLLIQKNLIRDSCSEIAQFLLKKFGIFYVDDIDRKTIESISKLLNIKPISDPELIVENDESINNVLEVEIDDINGMLEIKDKGCTIVVSGCDQMVVDEAERCFNDALSVVKCLMNEPYIVPGGGSIETGVSVTLDEYNGIHSLIVKEISKGIISMPYFLVSNAGMPTMEVVSQLRKNISINKNLGINLRTGHISDMVNDDGVIQPAAVSRSTFILAIECVQVLVKIDDILPAIQ